MARHYRYINRRDFQRPDGPPARTDGWSTRYYHRKTGGTMVYEMTGLNVTDSDLTRRKGESPYLLNARMNGTKETRNRAQSMSRPGQKFWGVPEGSETTNTLPVSDGITWGTVKEFRSIRYKMNVASRVTSIGLYLRRMNILPTSSMFLAIVRDPETNAELCRAFVPVEDITSSPKGELYWFRLIRTFIGDITIELTLIDDISKPTHFIGNEVGVLMSGADNHDVSEHDVPNLDKALREKEYVYTRGVGVPVTSTKTTDWKTFPVWIQNGYFTAENKRWIPVGVIKGDGSKAIYKYSYIEVTGDGKKHNRVTSEVTELVPHTKIDQQAEQVRMTQAGDALYFVDGYSALQRVKLASWTVEPAVPQDLDLFDFVPNTFYFKGTIIFRRMANGGNNVLYRALTDFQAEQWDPTNWEAVPNWQDEYTAWKAASLIYFFNNRLFLSGFYRDTVGLPPEGPKSEPNLVIMSTIDSRAPQYDLFKRNLEFFYTPDKSSAATATSPITAFADINDNLVIFRRDGLGFVSIPSGIEFGDASQSTPEGSGYGVLRQEHVVQGRNNIYFYNITEGVMRLGGTVSTIVSRPIDALLKRIVNPESVSMQYHRDCLRMYYHEDGDTNDQCLYDYAAYAIHRSYWFRDNQTPIAYMNSDNGYDVEIGVGSEYPCVIETEVLDSSDFDCAIPYEYHTNYLFAPNKVNGMIVRRVHVTTMQHFNSSLFVGLDLDHRDNPIVFRHFVEYEPAETTDADNVFYDTEDRGSTTLDNRILTANIRQAQIRVKQYCYKNQAEIMALSLEFGENTVL